MSDGCLENWALSHASIALTNETFAQLGDTAGRATRTVLAHVGEHAERIDSIERAAAAAKARCQAQSDFTRVVPQLAAPWPAGVHTLAVSAFAGLLRSHNPYWHDETAAAVAAIVRWELRDGALTAGQDLLRLYYGAIGPNDKAKAFVIRGRIDGGGS